MSSINVGGQTFSDNTYANVCSREKSLRTFAGQVVFSDTGRVLAIGPCDSCSTQITIDLYRP